MIIRNATDNDVNAILGLNDAYVHFTSPMSKQKLQTMDSQSCYHRVLEINGDVVAFLLAMDPNAEYLSDNFQWFKQRFESFAYIDRVVVSQSFQGLGLGKALYDDLFGYCRAQGITTIVCEYNIKPANIKSAQFHSSMGFSEVARLDFDGGQKQLSMQLAKLL
jgi:predicted GNAT superfamily acetyltransferase